MSEAWPTDAQLDGVTVLQAMYGAAAAGARKRNAVDYRAAADLHELWNALQAEIRAGRR